MSNFTWEIKRDCMQNPPEGDACVAAALSSLIATAGSVLPDGGVIFTSENERVAEYFLNLTERISVRAELWNASRDPKREKDKLTFLCTEEDARRLLLIASPDTGAYSFAAEEATALAYLRAAFLGGGSCTLPRGGAKTGYHLEFSFTTLESAEGFCELLAAFELLAKLLKRGERFVVYLKSREAISDFLSITGAESALKRLEEVSAEREENNNYNRVSNCFAGNADKSAIASAAQIVALRRLEEEGRFAGLSEALRETARARIERPTQSLSELAGSLGVSKSCLNHRLRKLVSIAAELQEKE